MSCEDPFEANRVDKENHPQWVVDLIETYVTENSALHSISVLNEYKYNGKYTYEMENPLFSCAHCYLYEWDGELFTPDMEYINGREFIQNIWSGSGL